MYADEDDINGNGYYLLQVGTACKSCGHDM